jgi:hypothetical protein
MVLTKVETGWFRGAKNATVTMRLEARDGGTAKAIAAAYDQTAVPVAADGTFEVKLVSGKKSFAVVYASPAADTKVDLLEFDAVGDIQKLRYTLFDPAWPTVQIWLEGK